MKTIYVSRLNHSKPRRSLLGKIITEYDTYVGTVKEICPRSGNRAPKYVLKSTREPINVIIL